MVCSSSASSRTSLYESAVCGGDSPVLRDELVDEDGVAVSRFGRPFVST
jgi:hypothetical protein